MKSIKDLIYFDFEKAKSLNSQLNDGLVSKLTRAIEDESTLKSDIGFDIKIIKGKIGSNNNEKLIKTETIELYHELLSQIENSLLEHDILTDINLYFDDTKLNFNDFLTHVPKFTYIKATGWSTFEDFERFKIILSNLNEIQRLIFCSGLETNLEIQQLRKQINDLKKEQKQKPLAKENMKLRALEKKLDSIIENNSGASFLEENFIERLKIFLDTFSANRLNFRLAPFDIFNDFQILANLKSDYLVNGNFNNVIYTYGSRPNVKLTVFGIVTSCPQKPDIRMDLNEEYIGYDDSELTESERYIKAFRNVFSSFEKFEKFFFVPSHPKIAISPIAIYREVKLEK